MSPSADSVSAGGHTIGWGAKVSTTNPRKIQKLESRRVRLHVADCLHRVLLLESCEREAKRCRDILTPSWETLDLYTLAFDLAEEDDLRFLVGQARAAILSELIKRSTNPRSSLLPRN